MPQNEYVETAIKRRGRRLDHDVKLRKKEARLVKVMSAKAQKTTGLKAKMLNKKRRLEKISLKKSEREISNRNTKSTSANPIDGSMPAYLLDRENEKLGQIMSSNLKQRRKERAGKWDVAIPKVKAVGEDEVFKIVKTGKRQKKAWKRMVTKVTYVGENYTRKPPKYERFIRPMGLRFTKAHVTHPELKTTFYLPIIGVKKNPSSALYTNLGVITKGTVIEVNVAELGLVTNNGKIIWGKYAQVTNNPENDGCINAVMLV